MLDLLNYLRGDGRLYELVNNLGSAEVAQTQTEPNNVFYHVKNSQWEELWADDVFIYRGTDTSPGNGQLYMLSENNHYGSAWTPRWMNVGDVFRRSATVIWRQKSNGAAVPDKPTAVAVTYLRVAQLYDKLSFQSGIQLQNVVELHALLDDGGKPAASPWEKYFYAQGFGLVAFQDMFGGFTSWIAQKFTPETMPQRVREVIPWLKPLQKRYYLPTPPTTTATTGQFVVSKLAGSKADIRAYPNPYGKDVGDLNKGDVVTLFTPPVDNWIMVQKGSQSGWVSQGDSAIAFAPSDGQPTPLPTLKPIGAYTLTTLPSSWVNIRDYPNTSGNDVGDLHKGDAVTMYSPDVDGWVYVDTGSVHGWVSRQNGLVTFTVVSTPTPPTTPIPPVDLPPLPNETAVGPFVLSKLPGTWINVRAYPDNTTGADVGDLIKGDVVTLYTPEVNGWVFVQNEATHGWVSRQSGKVDFMPMIDPTIPHDDLPPLPDETAVGQFSLSKLPGTWVNVRAYPNNGGADIDDLRLGDVVTLHTPEVDGWVLIQNDRVYGWVSRQGGKVDFTPVAAGQTQDVVVMQADAQDVQYHTEIAPMNGNGNGNGNAAISVVNASAAIVPVNGDISLSADSLPNSKDDAMRMRDAFQHVEEGARKVRTELERLIGRMKD